MKPIATSAAAALLVIAIAPEPVVALLLAVIGALLVVAGIVRAAAATREPRKGWQPAIAIGAPETATRPDRGADRVRGSAC